MSKAAMYVNFIVVSSSDQPGFLCMYKANRATDYAASSIRQREERYSNKLGPEKKIKSR